MREASDDDDGAPEHDAARQGFAHTKVPWSNLPWELVLRTNQTMRY
jgi:hypothetical protein